MSNSNPNPIMPWNRGTKPKKPEAEKLIRRALFLAPAEWEALDSIAAEHGKNEGRTVTAQEILRILVQSYDMNKVIAMVSINTIIQEIFGVLLGHGIKYRPPAKEV